MDSLHMLLSALLLLMIQWTVPNWAAVQFTLTSSKTTISITWNGDPTSTYTQYSIVVDGVVLETNNGNRLQTNGVFVIDQLETETTYYIYMNGTNTNGDSVEILPLTEKSTSPYSVNIDPVIETGAAEEFLDLNWYPESYSSPDSYGLAYQDLDTPGGTLQMLQNLPLQLPYRLEGLLPGHNYSIDVYAVKDGETSMPSRIYANTVPEAPVITDFSASDTSTLVLQWTGGLNSIQDGFDVSYRRMGQSSWYPVSGCSALQCTIDASTSVDASFIPGTTFEAAVVARRGLWTSAEAKLIGTTMPLGDVEMWMDERTTGSLLIKWDSVSGTSVTTYSMTMMPADGSTFGPQQYNNVWEFSADDLTAGLPYTFTVVAISNNVESLPSIAQFYTLPPVPQSPSQLEAREFWVSVTWSAPSSGEFEEYVVTIVRKSDQTSAGLPVTVSSSASKTATFTNLIPGAMYTVSVRTVVGSNVQSDAIDADMSTLPLPPEDLQIIEQTSTSLQVQWEQPPATTENVLSSFWAQIQGVPSSQRTLAVGSTLETTFNNLEPGTQYTVEVASVSNGQNSEIITGSFYTNPREPSFLEVVSVSTVSLTVEWAQPTGSTSYDGYIITLQDGSTTVTTLELAVSTVAYTFEDLVPATTYTVTLVSTMADVISMSISIDTTTKPNPPESLILTDNTMDTVSITWSAPSQVVPVSTYMVTITQVGSSTSFVSTEVTDTSYTQTGLRPGAVYSISVQSIYLSVQSSPTTTSITMLPSSVASMAVEETTSTSITVSWSEPTGTDLTLYELNIYPNDNNLELPVQVLQEQLLEYTFAGLSPGILYNISINSASGSSRSDPISREISTEPSSVSDLHVTLVTTNTITITWSVNEQSSQTHFQVSYYPEQGGSTTSVQVQFSQGVYSYTLTLTGLSSGLVYAITVNAVSNSILGDTVLINQITVPQAAVSLEVVPSSSTTATLTWQVQSNSFQDYFQYHYKGLLINGNEEFSELVNTTDTSVTFSNLSPGEQYQFEVFAVSGDRTSDPASAFVTMYPLPPWNLTVDTTQTTTNLIEIVWFPNPFSYIEDWYLRYAPYGTSDWEELSMEYVESESGMRRTLTGLTSGQNYTVQVYGVTTNNLVSLTALEVQATVKPAITTVLSENTPQTTETKVSVNYTENMGVFDGYLFSINEPGVPDIYKRKSDTDHTVNFLNLQAGRDYTVSVIITSGAERSSDRTVQVTTRPYPPTLEANQEATRITLYIIQPPGGVDQYLVECASSEVCTPASATINPSPNDPNIPIEYTNLVPYTSYNFQVRSIKGNKESNVVTEVASTEEAPPGEVQNFRVTEQTPSMVTLAWDQPLEQNGNITGYWLTYWRFDSNWVVVESHGGPDVLGPNERSKTYGDLLASYNYTFQIRATTNPGPGTPKNLTFVMPILAPFVAIQGQNAVPVTENMMVSHDSFAAELVNVFSNANGPIRYYTVIVTSDLSEDDSPGNTLSWAAVQGTTRKTYQAISKCSNFYDLNDCSQTLKRRKRDLGTSVVFDAGTDECDIDATDKYCNGPLTPETTYFVKIRAFTSDMLYADGPWSAPVTTSEAPSNTLYIIIAVVVAVVVLLIVVILTMYLVRRGVCNAPIDAEMPKVAMRSNLSHRNTAAETSRPVKVADFIEHCRIMAADTEFKYSEEFEDLKHIGRDQPTIASELPVNRNKNRFTNILPYDHSRVKLLPTDDEDGSDYINANYMPGYNSKREFIVTQGPLPSTRDDFWRMVWEQNCRAIVMLTKCVEKGREKCDHYWPVDSEPMYYGDLQVLILNETKCDKEWIVTEFKISKGETSRKLSHFHYIAWPDFGVPEKPQSLVRFVRLVRTKLQPHGGPVIVHCSAGVGRSGTFIALDHLFQHMRRHDTVDIFSLVYEMRKHRVAMVQTEQQYICIHNCLLCVLEGQEEDTQMNFIGEDNDAFEEDEGITVDVN